MRFVVTGAPRTKKNHQRIIRVKGVPRIAQARTAVGWEELAIVQLKQQMRRDRGKTFSDFPPFNLRALVYREKNTGDIGNYLAAVCDALERAGVVENDRLIGGFDGSRLLVDRKAPRVEIELTSLVEVKSCRQRQPRIHRSTTSSKQGSSPLRLSKSSVGGSPQGKTKLK